MIIYIKIISNSCGVTIHRDMSYPCIFNLYEFTTKGAGLFDLLLRRCDRHEHLASYSEMAAGKGKPLSVIARTCADEIALIWMAYPPF